VVNLNKPGEWNEEDLTALIENQVDESTRLDYKRCDSLQKMDEKKKEEVGKDVSAFANTDGGTIVYGIKERKKRGKPECLDIGFDPAEIKKEWLENVIHSRIKPPLGDIKINSISLNTHSSGKVAYVVIIPKGKTCHQASDGRFYRRTNSSNRILEHWEILEIMNREKFPQIAIHFSFSQTDGTGKNLNISLTNDGAIRAKDLKVVFSLPSWLEFTLNGIDSKKIELDVEYEIRRSDMVLFPKDSWDITDSEYQMVFKYNSDVYAYVKHNHPILKWKIYADDMVPKDGEIFLEELVGFPKFA